VSATRYMLDTNIVSELARNPSGKCARKLERVGTDGLCISIIVAAELRFGLRKRGSPQLTQQMEAILDELEVIPLDQPADEEYARIRLDLELKGTPISPNDLLIAAHARSIDATLVTANIREFKRVHGLRVENWMA
jgi:tRNA(fMet)-specific endonuclease VapC